MRLEDKNTFYTKWTRQTSDHRKYTRCLVHADIWQEPSYHIHGTEQPEKETYGLGKLRCLKNIKMKLKEHKTNGVTW